MKRAIARGIDTIEELEQVKRKEVEALATAEALSITSAISTTLPLLDANFVSL